MSFEGSKAVIVKDLSGNILQISGGALTVAGTINATAQISGQTIALWGGSGRNAIYLTNQSGTLPAIIDASGRLAVTASGLSVYNVSGGAAALFSVGLQSGVGGNVIQIAGSLSAAIASINQFGQSDSFSTASANALDVNNVNFGYDQTADRFSRLRISASGSAASQGGAQHRLFTDVTQGGLNIKTADFVPATALSGGIALGASGVCIHGIRIKSISGVVVGQTIHIGSSGNPPYISGGYQLTYLESAEFKAINPAFIRVFSAGLSGAPISWAGVDF